jgi:hypothetical protein
MNKTDFQNRVSGIDTRVSPLTKTLPIDIFDHFATKMSLVPPPRVELGTY